MASDEDYMAFLDKANRDPNEGYAKPAGSGKQEFKTTDAGARVPAVLRDVVKDSFYVSDADEPFVPVCLKWDEGGKGLPDEGSLNRSFVYVVVLLLDSYLYHSLAPLLHPTDSPYLSFLFLQMLHRHFLRKTR